MCQLNKIETIKNKFKMFVCISFSWKREDGRIFAHLLLFIAGLFLLISIFLPSVILAENTAAKIITKYGQQHQRKGACSETAKRGVLRLGINAADIKTLDPHFAASFGDRLIVDMVFNGLIRYKPGNVPLIEADLVESIPEPENINGKQVWTFKLRKGIMCHSCGVTNAYELTAEDVVYSFQKSADPHRCAYAGEYAGIAVKKIDDYTIRFVLDKPLSPVLFLTKLTDYAGGFIVCKKAAEKMGDEAFKSHPVGTGPFKFTSYSPRNNVTLTANDLYFRGKPLLKGVKVFYNPSMKELEFGIKTDKFDVIRGKVKNEWVERIDKEKDILVDVFGVYEVTNLYFNTSIKPMDDIRVRKAIAYALDRGRFLSNFGKGVALNIYAPVSSNFLTGRLTEDEVRSLKLDYAVNIEKSRELLAKAGYPEGFSIEVITSEIESLLKNYTSLKNQLAAIGILIDLKIVGHSRMHTLIRLNKSPLVIYSAWRPNTDVFLTHFFHSDSKVGTGKKPNTNFSQYDQIDYLIETARHETDPDKQNRLWEYAQVKLLEDMVVYPIHYRKKVYVRKRHVDYGYKLNASMALYPQITENTRMGK